MSFFEVLQNLLSYAQLAVLGHLAECAVVDPKLIADPQSQVSQLRSVFPAQNPTRPTELSTVGPRKLRNICFRAEGQHAETHLDAHPGRPVFKAIAEYPTPGEAKRAGKRWRRGVLERFTKDRRHIGYGVKTPYPQRTLESLLKDSNLPQMYRFIASFANILAGLMPDSCETLPLRSPRTRNKKSMAVSSAFHSIPIAFDKDGR